ncbi:MAG: EutN/CcmL family microcompartment protein [Hyphomicrobiaceae bacterium]
MKIGRVIGHVTATVKDTQLAGLKLLLVNIEDGDGAVLEPSIVAADTCSAGPGDMVLILTGSAARLPAAVAGLAVDATITAVLDDIKIAGARAGRAKS